MALLTAEEKEKLAKEGIGYGIREKCDCCHRPILSPLSYIKKGQTLCASCAKGQDLVLTNTKEENEMATKKAEKKASGKEEKQTKIAGHLIPGTAIADLYLFLEDEKRHSLKDTLKAIAKHKADKMGRLKQLARYGKKFGTWGVSIDEDADTVQLKMGKGAAKEAASKPAKKESKKEEPEEKEASGSKQQKVVQRLVRGVLKDTSKEWTRSKVIEKLKADHDLDPKRVQEAIQTEIKLGGVTIKGGLLNLV